MRILIAFFLVTLGVAAQPHPISAKKVETIAHEMLRKEFEAFSSGTNAPSAKDYAARVEILDRVIQQSIERIQRLTNYSATPQGIRKAFEQVEDVLVENNFVLCIPTHSLWYTLSTNSICSRPYLTRKMFRHRAAESSARVGDMPIDCDTGSFIYLAVFGVLKKPVVLVETPNHNFVRWRISRDEYVNWDPNAGRSFTDDDYRTGAYHSSLPFDRDWEKREGFLKDFTQEHLQNYHLTLIADIYRRTGQPEKAVEAYKQAIKQNSKAAVPHNNLAWLIATEPTLQEKQLLDLALKVGETAVRLRPKANGMIDTLAAVYAARGEFQAAIAVEKGGANNPDRLRAYEERKKPAQLDWRLEADSF